MASPKDYVEFLYRDLYRGIERGLGKIWGGVNRKFGNRLGRINRNLEETFNCGMKYGNPDLREHYVESFEENKQYFLGLMFLPTVGFSPIPLPLPITHGTITRPITSYLLRKTYKRNNPSEKNPHSWAIILTSILPSPIGPWVYAVPSFINGRDVFPILIKGFWDKKKNDIKLSLEGWRDDLLRYNGAYLFELRQYQF